MNTHPFAGMCREADKVEEMEERMKNDDVFKMGDIKT